MNLSLHHFFILCKAGAPEADSIAACGLQEGSSNDHPGQGTANRRFFFANTVLELLFIRDEKEVAEGGAASLHLVERAADKQASPFGLIFYQKNHRHTAPFPGWRYCPEYFPAEQCFHIGENAAQLDEPLCICMPEGFPPPSNPQPPANTSHSLTRLDIGIPATEPSQVLQQVSRCEGVTLQAGTSHRLELTFNAGREGVQHDLTQDLPLILHW